MQRKTFWLERVRVVMAVVKVDMEVEIRKEKVEKTGTVVKEGVGKEENISLGHYPVEDGRRH